MADSKVQLLVVMTGLDLAYLFLQLRIEVHLSEHAGHRYRHSRLRILLQHHSQHKIQCTD